jgi:hypothetical protein
MPSARCVDPADQTIKPVLVTEKELAMTYTANKQFPVQGKLRSALAAAAAFLESLDHSSADDMLDRIDRLERAVAKLNEEPQQTSNQNRCDARQVCAQAPQR